MFDPTQATLARDGFEICRERVDPAVCEALRASARAWVERLAPQTRSTFSTDSRPQNDDASFLASANEIALFWEEGPSGRVPNKLGHALHELDDAYRRFCHTGTLPAFAARLGIGDALLVQSMVIFKEPGHGGAVSAHQDATFLRTDPATCVGFWLALDDADAGNGGLEVLPGAHWPIRQHYERHGDRITMRDAGEAPWPDNGWIPLSVPAGTLVALDGHLPHRSAANRSARSRAAFTLHTVSPAAHWRDDNWIRRESDRPFPSFAAG